MSEGIGMQKKVSDSTLRLINGHLSGIGIALPLKSEENVQTIDEYFEEIEISLSNALSDGGRVDRSQLDEAVRLSMS